MNKCKPFHYPRIEANKIICLRCLKVIGKIRKEKKE